MANLTVGLLCLGLVIPPLTGGKQEKDPPEPPVRLKKKEKSRTPDEPDKKAEPAKPAEPKEPAGPPSADAKEPNAAEILARVSKDMRASEDRLGNRDPGDGTQEIQRDILKNLDALIEQKRREQQQQQQSASNSSSSQDRRRQQARNQRRTPNQTTPSQAASRQDQLQPAANPGGGARETGENMGKIADLYKDVWGHLPEALRQEMDQYAREKFMAKYGDLLKQYYTTIAEKGHRKGE